MDQHWVNMDKVCKQAAEELGCDYKWIAPDVKDDAKQIECVNNAVAGGYDAIMVAANGILSTTELAIADSQMMMITTRITLPPLMV